VKEGERGSIRSVCSSAYVTYEFLLKKYTEARKYRASIRKRMHLVKKLESRALRVALHLSNNLCVCVCVCVCVCTTVYYCFTTALLLEVKSAEVRLLLYYFLLLLYYFLLLLYYCFTTALLQVTPSCTWKQEDESAPPPPPSMRSV
jgi:hypothetical protein